MRHYAEIVAAADAEIPAVRARYKEQGYLGYLSDEDLREAASLGADLKLERERQGFDLAEVARRSGAKEDDLRALEEGRFSEPPMPLLTRCARPVGKSLMLGLRQAKPSLTPVLKSPSALATALAPAESPADKLTEAPR